MVLGRQVKFFDEEAFPEPEAALVGYAWLITEYRLSVPAPDEIYAIIPAKNAKRSKGRWRLLGSRYKPDAHWFAQLTFALKYEGVDLAIIRSLFIALGEQDVTSSILTEPTGAYSRRIWFLYEWLIGQVLPIEDATSGNYVDALNEALQFGCRPRKIARQRINNNLPGVSGFCPLIKKTDAIVQYIEAQLSEKAIRSIGGVHSDLLARAAAFLLLSDSKASYSIEGERPPRNRIERWGKIIGQAGQKDLTIDEIERLQEIVIPDNRFIVPGIRVTGGFVGEHDRVTNLPIPEHISAKPEDLNELLSSYLDAYHVMKVSEFHPVLMATVIAFSFVFIHPLEDGNGRIHRYLMHHVLSASGFTPKGVIFPVSAVILKKIGEYKSVLESFTKPRLRYIEWEPTGEGNVHVTNDTIDLYRYGDMTRQAEFLFACVKDTVEQVLPEEVRYLKRYDEVWEYLNNRFDMPHKDMSLLLNFLTQGKGRLSQRAKGKEFAGLTDEEVAEIESKYHEVFFSDAL
ncbi:Fic family protein [Aliidiomarina halalkaliphila]|uniref:Fic family protein n=1 Tax=Aliidiomarina halalkaliphila TaxID=2593535 RepID=A0A552X1P6_9GAMM|nr:Fic family protein [Aliidiomarina halalkaliphila]TRW48905.1 Fic family protein [Aliidiomarina halalkaliphila]